jgi:hypothetical protein
MSKFKKRTYILQPKLKFMKQVFLPVLITAFSITACNNDKQTSKTDVTDSSAIVRAASAKAMTNAADEMNKKMESLKSLTPLSTDELKALLPEEISGIKQTEYNTSSSLGYSVAQGDYKKNDSTDVQLMIYDCAGEAGANWYGVQYIAAMNYQQENSHEYSKTIDFMGGKALETYNKDSHETTLTYSSNERLLVIIKGRNMSPDELKAAAQKLNMKVG